MWSGGRTLACHECGQGSNPIHSTWRLLLYFLFLKFFPTLLKCCHNAALMLCVFIAQYMALSLLCIQYFSMLLQCSLNGVTMLQSTHHHKYQIPDGCLMDTTLHKCCHNAATMLSTLHTITWDAVRCGYYHHRQFNLYLTVGASSESCFI